MASITQTANGDSVYTLGGVTYNAKTGGVYTPPAAPPAAPPAGSGSGAPQQSDAQRAAAYAGAGIPTDPSGKVARYPTTDTNASGTPVDAAETAYETSTTPEDPAALNARIAATYQTQLAGIQSYYAGLKTTQDAAQQTVNDKNAGRTRATAAASGVLGSTFGDAQENTTDQAGRDAMGLVDSGIAGDESNAEAAVYGKIADTTNTELDAEKAANTTALQNRITYLQNVATQARSQTQTVAASTSLDDLSQEQYDDLYAKSGFSNADEFNTFYEAARTAALQGVKLTGDSTTGYYMPTVGADGSVSYKNVIKGTPQVVNGGQYGTYQLDPSSGSVTQLSPGQTTKIYSSGGQLFSVDMTTHKATPITQKISTSTDKIGWGKDEQSTLAVQSWVENNIDDYNSTHGTTYTPTQLLGIVKTNPDAFLEALNQAFQAHIYLPSSLLPDTSGSDAAASAATDAADQTFNAQN